MNIKLLLLLFCFNFSNGFLPYPFLADNLLGTFLKTINKTDKTIDLTHFIPGEQCKRLCRPNDRRLCHFTFTLKYFHIMGGACQNCTTGTESHCFHSKCIMADGVKRSFLSINAQLPAPPIHVCKDDVIIVDLSNDADGTATSIHWHGMRQIEGTQYFDGAPYLTQCPIPYGNRFRYAFTADDEGTHFYHSHSGHQKANGIFGALIVRAPDKPLLSNREHYDHDLPEHYIIVCDWMQHLAEEDFPGMTSRSILSRSILVNGHGRFFNTSSETYENATLTIYNVEPNKRYRFRFINSGFNVCPFLLQIEHHNMTIIASEISYVEPFTIDSLYSLTGERFDFVIHTNNTPGDYWIRVQTMFPCRTVIEGFAVLRYSNKSGSDVAFTDNPPRLSNDFPQTRLFNSPKPKEKDIPFLILNAYEYDESILKDDADFKFYLFLDSPTITDDVLYTKQTHYRMAFETTRSNFNSIGTFNNISLLYPSFPLLTQPEMIDESMFCNENSTIGQFCTDNGFGNVTACRCVHRIKADLNSIVEFIVVNVDDQIAHPIHLHGHRFHILDMGVYDKKPVPGLVRNGGIPNYTHKRPPYKDTCILPYPGYVRLRFRADNPGFWLFHCHFDWHLETGMSVILQVGELSQMTKPPKDFPKCSNFKVTQING